jgi:hypothetical protein
MSSESFKWPISRRSPEGCENISPGLSEAKPGVFTDPGTAPRRGVRQLGQHCAGRGWREAQGEGRKYIGMFALIRRFAPPSPGGRRTRTFRRSEDCLWRALSNVSQDRLGTRMVIFGENPAEVIVSVYSGQSLSSANLVSINR